MVFLQFCLPLIWHGLYLLAPTASHLKYYTARTTDTQWRHKSKKSENLGRCGRQNMLRPYLKIWEWEWIFGRAVKTISSSGVRSPCHSELIYNYTSVTFRYTKAHSNPLTHLGAIKSESLYVNRDFGNQPLKGGDSDCLQRGIKWDTRQSLKPTLLPYHHYFWPWSWLNKWLSRVNSQ